LFAITEAKLILISLNRNYWVEIYFQSLSWN